MFKAFALEAVGFFTLCGWHGLVEGDEYGTILQNNLCRFAAGAAFVLPRATATACGFRVELAGQELEGALRGASSEELLAEDIACSKLKTMLKAMLQKSQKIIKQGTLSSIRMKRPGWATFSTDMKWTLLWWTEH